MTDCQIHRLLCKPTHPTALLPDDPYARRTLFPLPSHCIYVGAVQGAPQVLLRFDQIAVLTAHLHKTCDHTTSSCCHGNDMHKTCAIARQGRKDNFKWQTCFLQLACVRCSQVEQLNGIKYCTPKRTLSFLYFPSLAIFHILSQRAGLKIKACLFFPPNVPIKDFM